MPKEIATLTTRIAYENRWLRVREDTIRRKDGSDGLYGVIERADFVIVVALQDNAITLVEQYRYPIEQRLWELPMGIWEDRPDVDPATLAAAELREETGLIASAMHHAGTIFQGPGFCNQRGHIYLATGLSQGPTAREATEQDMVSRAFPVPEIERMIRDNSLQDAMTITAFSLLRLQNLL